MVTPLDKLKEKFMKDPDIIPKEGEDKEAIAEAMAQQQLRQRKNNDRAFELLNKAGSGENADPGGGSKEGGDSAMYRLTEFVNKPIDMEKTDHLPPRYGPPTKKQLKIMNRPFSVLDEDDVAKIELDPPPKDGSEAQQKELEELKDMQKLLDNETLINAIEAQDKNLLAPFERYMRDNDLDVDGEELAKLNKDVSTIVHKFKFLFNRRRPHQASDIEEFENIAGKSPSYPSGHTTNATVMAELFADMFPEHADKFRKIGTEIGVNRVISGLHYPTDHMAGLELARQIVPLVVDKKVLKSDAFMDELFKYMAHREELFKDMTQIGTQDILDGVRIDKESNPRIPRKKGQPAKSKKHSDLYTDEDPKGTITGLGFKDDATARASVKKIKNSGRSHAHKIQAAVAMEQRAKAAGKSSEAGIYRKYIDSMKEKTKRLEKHSEEQHGVEHVAEEKPFSMDAAKESLNEQLKQIQNKLTTGDYQIEKFLSKAEPIYGDNEWARLREEAKKVQREKESKRQFKVNPRFTSKPSAQTGFDMDATEREELDAAQKVYEDEVSQENRDRLKELQDKFEDERTTEEKKELETLMNQQGSYLDAIEDASKKLEELQTSLSPAEEFKNKAINSYQLVNNEGLTELQRNDKEKNHNKAYQITREDALRQAAIRRDQNIEALNTLRGSMSAEEAEEQLKTYKQELEKLKKDTKGDGRRQRAAKKRLNVAIKNIEDLFMQRAKDNPNLISKEDAEKQYDAEVKRINSLPDEHFHIPTKDEKRIIDVTVESAGFFDDNLDDEIGTDALSPKINTGNLEEFLKNTDYKKGESIEKLEQFLIDNELFPPGMQTVGEFLTPKAYALLQEQAAQNPKNRNLEEKTTISDVLKNFDLLAMYHQIKKGYINILRKDKDGNLTSGSKNKLQKLVNGPAGAASDAFVIGYLKDFQDAISRGDADALENARKYTDAILKNFKTEGAVDIDPLKIHSSSVSGASLPTQDIKIEDDKKETNKDQSEEKITEGRSKKEEREFVRQQIEDAKSDVYNLVNYTKGVADGKIQSIAQSIAKQRREFVANNHLDNEGKFKDGSDYKYVHPQQHAFNNLTTAQKDAYIEELKKDPNITINGMAKKLKDITDNTDVFLSNDERKNAKKSFGQESARVLANNPLDVIGSEQAEEKTERTPPVSNKESTQSKLNVGEDNEEPKAEETKEDQPKALSPSSGVEVNPEADTLASKISDSFESLQRNPNITTIQEGLTSDLINYYNNVQNNVPGYSVGDLYGRIGGYLNPDFEISDFERSLQDTVQDPTTSDYIFGQVEPTERGRGPRGESGPFALSGDIEEAVKNASENTGTSTSDDNIETTPFESIFKEFTDDSFRIEKVWSENPRYPRKEDGTFDYTKPIRGPIHVLTSYELTNGKRHGQWYAENVQGNSGDRRAHIGNFVPNEGFYLLNTGNEEYPLKQMHANKIHFIDFNMSGDAEQKLIKQYADDYNLDPNSLNIYDDLQKVLTVDELTELNDELNKILEDKSNQQYSRSNYSKNSDPVHLHIIEALNSGRFNEEIEKKREKPWSKLGQKHFKDQALETTNFINLYNQGFEEAGLTQRVGPVFTNSIDTPFESDNLALTIASKFLNINAELNLEPFKNPADALAAKSKYFNGSSDFNSFLNAGGGTVNSKDKNNNINVNTDNFYKNANVNENEKIKVEEVKVEKPKVEEQPKEEPKVEEGSEQDKINNYINENEELLRDVYNHEYEGQPTYTFEDFLDEQRESKTFREFKKKLGKTQTSDKFKKYINKKEQGQPKPPDTPVDDSTTGSDPVDDSAGGDAGDRGGTGTSGAAEGQPPRTPKDPTASDKAREIYNTFSNYPKLFNRDKNTGEFTLTSLASAQGGVREMATRYRDLQRLNTEIDQNVSSELRNIDRGFGAKFEEQVRGLSVHLPNNILKKLNADFDRHVEHDGRHPVRDNETGVHLRHSEETAKQTGKKAGDLAYESTVNSETGEVSEIKHGYHDDTHKERIKAERIKDTENEDRLDHLEEINAASNHHTNEGVEHLTDHPVFNNNAAYQYHQTPTEWTPQLENDIVTKHTRDLNAEKGEGNWTQADIDQRRKEAGEPPGPPPQRKTPGPPLQWAGPISGWVKPETAQEKGLFLNNLARGFGNGTVLADLHNVKDKNGESFITMNGSAAKNLGAHGIVVDEGKGFNGSRVALVHGKPITNEHGNITNENVHNFTTNDQVAKNLNTLTNVAHNIVNSAPTKHESLEHKGLVAYDPNQKTSRLSSFRDRKAGIQQTGGVAGALDRFKAATLPAKLGGGKLKDQVVRQTPEGKNFVSSPHVKPAVVTTNREGQSIEPKPILSRVKSVGTGAATGAAVGAAAAGPLGAAVGGVGGAALGALQSFLGRSKKE